MSEPNTPTTITANTALQAADNGMSREMEALIMRPQNQEVWEMYKRHMAAFWTAGDIDLSRDYADFCSFTPDVQNFILEPVTYFTFADGVIVNAVAEKLLALVGTPEGRAFYGFQLMIENVHAEVYADMLRALTLNDPVKENKLFNALRENPVMIAKREWAERWMTATTTTLPETLIACAAWEGIGFSSSFATIYWIRSKGKMPGTTFANDYITRDEDLHVQHGCLQYKLLPPEQQLPVDIVHHIIGEAVELEKAQVCRALRVTIPGLNARMMCEYVEYIADHLLKNLGYSTMYNVPKNPLPYMDLIGLPGRPSFFEVKSADYRKAGISSTLQAAMKRSPDMDDLASSKGQGEGNSTKPASPGGLCFDAAF